MLKKILLLGAAIAAFAALAAPAAQAEGTVTNALGEEAEHITVESENLIWQTNGVGELTCETVALTLTKTEGVTGHYVSPSSTSFIAQGHRGNHSDPECEAKPSGLTFFVTEFAMTLNIEGGGVGIATFRFTYDITHPTLGSIMCEFQSSAAASADYEPTTDVVQFKGKMIGGPAPFCPTAGETSGTFTVTDEFGEPTSIH